MPVKSVPNGANYSGKIHIQMTNEEWNEYFDLLDNDRKLFIENIYKFIKYTHTMLQIKCQCVFIYNKYTIFDKLNESN